MIKKMTTVNERILYLIENQCNGNQKKFSEKINFAPQVIYNIVSGRKSKPSFDVLNSILLSFVDLNSEWLLTGKGEMLKTEKKAVEKTKKFIPAVEIIAPERIEGRDLMPKVVVVDDADNERIPLVPVKAQAGYLAAYDDPVYIQTLPTYSLPTLIDGTFRMFQVAGHSMYPTLQNNSYVVGEFVDNWEHITDNRIYVVVTNEGVIVKRVLNKVRKYGSLYCKSDNREYPNISVNIREVKEIWECKMHLSFEFLDPISNYEKIANLEKDMTVVKEKIAELEEENKKLKQ